MSEKALVVDTNILIRAILGQRVRELISAHATTVRFFAPDVAYVDAHKYLPGLLSKRGIDPDPALYGLSRLQTIRWSQSCTKASGRRRYGAWAIVTLTTGLCSPAP